MGDELLPKRSPDKHLRLVLINDIYHVKYSVRNSLGKRFQSYYKIMTVSGLLSVLIFGVFRLFQILLGFISLQNVPYSQRPSKDSLVLGKVYFYYILCSCVWTIIHINVLCAAIDLGFAFVDQITVGNRVTESQGIIECLLIGDSLKSCANSLFCMFNS